ncbi:MAG: BNR-4 repeat-containing protein [Pricia sp.]
MTKTNFKLFILILIIGFPLFAQKNQKLLDTVKLLSKTTLTQTGYCSDGTDRQRDGIRRFHGPMEARIIASNKYQYIAYYESNGEIVIARKKINSKSAWEKSILQGYKMKSEDRHNKIALSISEGDGVIHLSFDHHNTPQFNYAHSPANAATNPEAIVWDNSVFSLQPNLGLTTDTGLVTYPTFYQLNSSGNLLVYWRTGGSVGGEMNLANYSSTDNKWQFIGKISSQEGTYNGQKGTRGPYTGNFIDDANGTLHVAWVFREREAQRDVKDSRNYGEHGLFYAQSSDGGFTWENNTGKTIANVKSGKTMGIDNMRDVPVKIPMKLDPSHVGLTSILDPETDNLITLLNHYKPGTDKKANYLYIRTPMGVWTTQETNLDQRGKLTIQGERMFVFNESGISFSERSSDFSDWNRIPFPITFKKGSTNWDLKNLDQGVATMVIQYAPEEYGESSPIEIFDLKIFE